MIFGSRTRGGRSTGSEVAETWRRVAEAADGQMVPGSSGKDPALIVDVAGLTLEVEKEVVSTGQSAVVFTRARALFRAPDGFRLKVVRRNPLHRIAELFGGRDVRLGHRDFDRIFTVRTDAIGRARSLLARGTIVSALVEHPEWRLEVKPAGWTERRKLGGDVFGLQLRTRGLITDETVLEGFVAVATDLIEGLGELGVGVRRPVEPA